MSENDESLQPEMEQKKGSSAVSKANSLKSKTKNMKNMFSKMTKNKAGTRTLVKALSKILVTCGWYILAFIVIVGIIMFFLTMPGMVMEKLKGLFKALADTWSAWWGGDTTEQFEDVEIYNVLNYLDDMGYDLKGYGFVTEFLTKPIEEYVDGGAGENLNEEDPYSLKVTTDGVIRDGDDEIVTGISDFIRTYLVSENYIYTIKNFNQNDLPWYKAFGDHVSALFSDDLSNRKGMLVFYHDDGLGITSNDAYDAIELGSIEIEDKKLKIKKGWFNEAMTYSLDGWTGRYGMPVDFLLTIHLATQMPDLAYDMTQTFSPEIKILLHGMSGTVEGHYKTGDGKYIGLAEVNKKLTGVEGKNFFSKIWSTIDNWGLNTSEAQHALDFGIIPPWHNPPECGCELSNTIVLNKVINGVEYAYIIDKIIKNDDTTMDAKEFAALDEADRPAIKGAVYADYAINDGGDLSRQDITIEGTSLSEMGLTVEEKLVKIGNGDKDGNNNCKKYIKEVVWALQDVTDFNYSTYTPYIENVTDHWYRDVYFIADANKVNSFVDYDYQYELITGERWTMYETYGPENPEREGEFKYYVLEIDEETGEVSTGELYDGNVISGESLYDYDGNLISENGQTDKDGNKIEMERLASRGEDGTLVVKKAVTIDLSEKYEDLGWNKLSNGQYSAYNPEVKVTKEMTKGYTEQQLQEISDDNQGEKAAKNNIFIEVELGNIEQTGEGLRTETNNKIKKMFLVNNYFKYDGSQTTAEIIYALRQKAKEKGYSGYGPINVDSDGNELSKDELDKLLNEEYDLEFKRISDGGKFTSATDGKYKIKDYVGNVSFQQDSLNTFAMLENSHTLDADFIYRDFKELVVELGYFEKEELTESKPKILQWIVPEIGSSGYPEGAIDKREGEYGTLVHSKSDIDANRQQTVYTLISQLGSELPEELSGAQKADADGDVKGLFGMGTNISIDEVGKIGASKKPAQVPLSEFLDTTREMCEYINKEGYDYCVYLLPSKCPQCAQACKSAEFHDSSSCACTENHCKHKVHNNTCGLPKTFEASKSTGSHNFCCATLVSWALQNVGVMPDSDHKDGADELAAYIMSNLKPEVIQVGQPLEEGDILCYDGHIDIVGKKLSSGFEKYNGGHYTDIGSVEYQGTSCIEKISGWPDDSRIKFALRIKWGRGEPGIYVGYEGNEAVVSPVTGILMEYGTYDEEAAQENRENMDMKYGPLLEGYSYKQEPVVDENGKTVVDPETGEPVVEIKYPYDKVGYAVIKILDAETYQKLESKVDSRWKTDSLIKINQKSTNYNSENEQANKHVSFVEKTAELIDENRDWSKLDETIYGYKEFVEQYERFGIAGNYIYIDGFRCETVGETDEDEDDDSKKKSDNNQNRSPKIVTPGDPITIDSFKITPEQAGSDTFEPEVDNLYEADQISKLISQEYYDKLKAESGVKIDASTGITFKYLDKIKEKYTDANGEEKEKQVEQENEYILIKEGTVLGRTLTDEEIVDGEEYRNKEYGTYEEYLEAQKEYLQKKPEANAQQQPATPEPENPENPEDTSDEDIIIPKIPLMGNYLRLMMQLPDGSIVENVEDYLKLDDVKPKADNDWELFYWLPFESGGTDNDGDGPESQGTCSSGETAVGIIQWTVLTSKNMNNIAGQFIPGCLEEDPSLCASLAAYQSWSASDFWNDYCGDKEFQSVLSSICDADRDGFLHVQMEVAKKQYLEPLLEKYPWLEERPSCVQGEAMHLKVWGADTDWLSGYSNKSDEEIINKVRNVIANTSSTAGDATGDETSGRAYNEPQIALEILSGAMSADDVEQWVRTKDVSYLSFDWKG